VVKADRVAAVLRREQRQPTEEEAEIIVKADSLRDALIQVNDFENGIGANDRTVPGFVRPALKGTEELLSKAEIKSFRESLEYSKKSQVKSA